MIYTALSEDAMRAEFDRLTILAVVTRPAPRLMAAINVSLSRVLDLRDEDLLETLGVAVADLTADPPTLPRELGEAAHYLGYEAIIAPSAAGVGVVLAIFGDSRAATSSIEVTGTRTFDISF